MVKGICSRLFDRAKLLPLLIADGLGSDNDDISYTTINLLNLRQETISIERFFGHENNMWGILFIAFPQRRRGGQPTGITSHRFYHLNGIMPGYRNCVHRRITGGQSNETSRTAIAWAVIGNGQIIVNRLGDTDRLQLIASVLSRLSQSVSSIGRVIAANVE